MPDETTALTRRHLLMRSGGLAAVRRPVVAPEACAPAASTSPTKPNATGAPGNVMLPTSLPFQGQSQPDLPDNASELDPARFKFRSQLMQTVPQTRGHGSGVSAIVVQTYSPLPGPDQNAAWEAVNKRPGVNLRLEMVPSADYAVTADTLLADGWRISAGEKMRGEYMDAFAVQEPMSGE